jgi:hypothetical protein
LQTKGEVGECLMANDVLDKTRDLQIKLYRAAKRSPSRRFHALYDKVYRKDFFRTRPIRHRARGPVNERG